MDAGSTGSARKKMHHGDATGWRNSPDSPGQHVPGALPLDRPGVRGGGVHGCHASASRSRDRHRCLARRPFFQLSRDCWLMHSMTTSQRGHSGLEGCASSKQPSVLGGTSSAIPSNWRQASRYAARFVLRKNGTGSEPKRGKPLKICRSEGACPNFFTAGSCRGSLRSSATV
jgi:hypothetical protein